MNPLQETRYCNKHKKLIEVNPEEGIWYRQCHVGLRTGDYCDVLISHYLDSPKWEGGEKIN